jgi:hypothetical protein
MPRITVNAYLLPSLITSHNQPHGDDVDSENDTRSCNGSEETMGVEVGVPDG